MHPYCRRPGHKGPEQHSTAQDCALEALERWEEAGVQKRADTLL